MVFTGILPVRLSKLPLYAILSSVVKLHPQVILVKSCDTGRYMKKMNAAKIIQEKRKSNGLSKKDLATLLGISKMHVYDLEAYENEVEDTLTIKQIFKLAELIQIQPGILCSELQLSEISSEQAFKEIKNKIKKSNMPLERLSEKIGWDLGLCAKSVESIKEQPLMFFKDFAKWFKLPIEQILPKTISI